MPSRLPLSLLLFLLALTSLATTSRSESADEEPERRSLFNGRDLTGWKATENKTEFSAADGILKVRSGPDKQGATLWTEDEFTDFDLVCEFRMGEGNVDSGFFIKNEKEQIQIGISGSLKIDMTALAYIPGKGYPFRNDEAVTWLKKDAWNHLRIRVIGKTYETWLNGKSVMKYTSDSAVERGPIGIQLHGNRDMAIDYRNLKVADLK